MESKVQGRGDGKLLPLANQVQVVSRPLSQLTLELGGFLELLSTLPGHNDELTVDFRQGRHVAP